MVDDFISISPYFDTCLEGMSEYVSLLCDTV